MTFMQRLWKAFTTYLMAANHQQVPSRAKQKGLSSPLQVGHFNYECSVEIQRKFCVPCTVYTYKNLV